MKRYFRCLAGGLLVLVLAGCKKDVAGIAQGYVEGDFVHVAAPAGGQLLELKVERGAVVSKGDGLFVLDAVAEKAARDEAAVRVEQARANLEDLERGLRPSELAAIEAQLRDAKAGLDLARSEELRQNALLEKRATPLEGAQEAETKRKSAEAAVERLEADLVTAKLGGREKLIEAARNEIAARESVLEKAQWSLDQKAQDSPVGGVVTDTVYRQGDWVGAGSTVVLILPPANLKVRAYVSQEALGAIKIGDKAEVTVDGMATPFAGKVRYISPRAEYTPPVIYSKEMREKFVFLVEIAFPDEDLMKLHPGQPVDVRFIHPTK